MYLLTYFVSPPAVPVPGAGDCGGRAAERLCSAQYSLRPHLKGPTRRHKPHTLQVRHCTVFPKKFKLPSVHSSGQVLH